MNETAKIAVLTAAGKRVGACIASYLLEEGYKLLVHCHSSKDATPYLDGKFSDQVLSVTTGDLTSPQVYNQFLTECTKHKLNLLVHCASKFVANGFERHDLEIWDFLYKLEVKLPLQLIIDLKQRFVANDADIILFSDANISRSDYPAYGVAKSAVEALCKFASKALSPNVKVNCIAPGALLAPKDTSDAEKKLWEQNQAKIQKERLLSEADLLNTMKYIIGSKSVTGQIFKIDNGQYTFVPK